MGDPNSIRIVPGRAFRELPPSPKKVSRTCHAQGSGTGVWSTRRNIRDGVRLTWTTVPSSGSSRRRMGPGGNSVSAAQAKLRKNAKTKPARSENPSLMIYTRERSVACHAVGEALATPLVYLRSLAGLDVSRRPRSARLAEYRRVDEPCPDSAVHRPQPGCWVAGWAIRPIDDLFRRIEGGPLLEYLGSAELSFGIRQ